MSIIPTYTRFGEKKIRLYRAMNEEFVEYFLELCKFSSLLLRNEEKLAENCSEVIKLFNDVLQVYFSIICVKKGNEYIFIIDYIYGVKTINPTLSFILDLFGSNLFFESINKTKLILNREVIEEKYLPTIARLNDLFASLNCVIRDY